jgi:hypothetical protein
MGRLSLFLSIVIVISFAFSISCVSKQIPVTETYYVTENKIEYKTETYTTTENVVIKTTEGQMYLEPIQKWQTGIYLRRVGSGTGMSYYYGYDISTEQHSRVRVEINILQDALGRTGGIIVCDLTGFGQIPHAPETNRPGNLENGVYVPPPALQAWLDNLNSVLTDSARNLGYIDTNTGENNITFDAKEVKEFCIIANTWEKSISGVKLTWADDVTEQRTVNKEREVPYQVPVQVKKQRTVMKTKKVPFWEAWQTNPPAETKPSDTTTSESNTMLISDDFSDPNTGWFTGSPDWGEAAYENGEYSILVKKPRTLAFGTYDFRIGTQQDFIAEVDARRLISGDDDAAGIIFRIKEEEQGKYSYYAFWVNSILGTYAIEKYIEDAWASDIKSFASSDNISRGAITNRLKVVCKGSQIEVYVNEKKLDTVNDTSFVSGYIGLAARTFAGANAHYHFDNFKLYNGD